MAKNELKKKKSPMKKLIAATCMLGLSATMLGTSTYAWFTMNKDVSVTGMEVRTKVSGNLLISDNNVEADYTANQLSQTRAALLEPVSSVTGKTGSFFYTLDAKANGAKNKAITGDGAVPYEAYNEDVSLTEDAVDLIGTTADHPTTTGAGKAKVDDDFNGTAKGYGIGTYAPGAATTYYNAYGYVDYVFYLKATSDAASQPLRMTTCNFIRNNGTSDITLDTNNDAWRIAVFATNITAAGGKGLDDTSVDSTAVSAIDPAGSTARTILTHYADPSAANQTGTNCVATASTLSAATYNTAAVLDTFGATIGETRYYKVTVRVWLEGEDKNCTSETYAQLTQQYKLDVAFHLGDETAAVSQIGSDVE